MREVDTRDYLFEDGGLVLSLSRVQVSGGWRAKRSSYLAQR